MTESIARFLATLLGGSDRERAVHAERAMRSRLESAALPPAFARRERANAKRPDALRLGERLGPGASAPLLLTPSDLHTHFAVFGVTGSGKSYHLGTLVRELLRRAPSMPIVILDGKGELGRLALDRIVPAHLVGMDDRAREAFLDELVVVDPFASGDLAPLNVLVRDPSVPLEVQARDIADAFDGLTDAASGPRMKTILVWILRLAVEVGGSFLTVRRALEDPKVLAALVARSSCGDVRAYFNARLPKEPRTSVLSLLAALDRLLVFPTVRLALGARECVDFERVLERGFSVLQFGGGFAGSREIGRLGAALVLGRLVRAIERRSPVAGANRPAVVVVDEWPTMLTSAIAADFETLLATARSRSVYCILVSQQLAQLDRVAPTLRSMVLGEAQVHVTFRLAEDDARLMRHMFPTTGREARERPLPWESVDGPYLAAAAEREKRVLDASRLPERVAHMFDKRLAATIRFRSADLVLPDVRSLPRSLVERVRRGAVAVPVAELERQAREEEARFARSRVAASSRSAAPVARGSLPARRRRRGLPSIG